MELLENVKSVLEKYSKEFIRINDFIFDNPELGEEEFVSSEYLVNVLKNHGFEVEYPFCSMQTAFKASIIKDTSLPTICFLAEYDALPGYGEKGEAAHACGHNWIAATSLGSGILLSKLQSIYNGNIVVIGTPAEETVGGKCKMVEDGVFNDIDFVFQCHIGEKTNLNQKTLAMDSLEFEFYGRAAHAACFPEDGINALDAVNLLFAGINCLRQHVTSDVRIHGIITNGGSAPNITPDYASCRFYIRASSREYLNKIYKKVIDCAKGAELMTGTRLSFKNFENSFDNVLYIKSLQEIMEKNLKLSGIEKISYDLGSSAGSSDIGNVSQVCPTMYTEIALDAPENVKVHEKEILKYLSSEYAHEKMNKSILAMVLSAIELSQKSNKL